MNSLTFQKNDFDDLESPLEGLIDKPLHLMSDDEIRQQIVRLRELSESNQARAAAFKVRRKEENKPTVAFEGLEL